MKAFICVICTLVFIIVSMDASARPARTAKGVYDGHDVVYSEIDGHKIISVTCLDPPTQDCYTRDYDNEQCIFYPSAGPSYETMSMPFDLTGTEVGADSYTDTIEEGAGD